MITHDLSIYLSMKSNAKFSSSDIFQNTCLGSIVNDLRPIIDMYLDYHSPFAIGALHRKYFGYRLVTREDIESKSFLAYLENIYQKNNGFRSLDDFYGLHICGDDIDIIINGGDVSINFDARDLLPIKKNNVVQIYQYKNIMDIRCINHRPAKCDAGLFILVDHTLQ